MLLGVKWFCGRTNVGIVRVKDEHDGIRYYISAFELSKEGCYEDAKFIAEWGSSFPNEAGDVLFGVEREDHT